MTLVTTDPRTGLRRNPIRYPDGKPPAPFGCRWCGWEQRSHGWFWIASRGGHQWERPTDAQIKARMMARRTVRLTARATRRDPRLNSATSRSRPGR